MKCFNLIRLTKNSLISCSSFPCEKWKVYGNLHNFTICRKIAASSSVESVLCLEMKFKAGLGRKSITYFNVKSQMLDILPLWREAWNGTRGGKIRSGRDLSLRVLSLLLNGKTRSVICLGNFLFHSFVLSTSLCLCSILFYLFFVLYYNLVPRSVATVYIHFLRLCPGK